LGPVIYDIGNWFFNLSLHLAACFHRKARLLVNGRKIWKKDLTAAVEKKGSWVWFHCASLGEFEQGRPVMEALKKHYPQYRILLSFFSSSGYTIRKNYEYADAVIYFPADTKSNAAYLVKQLNPVLAVFVKYEFWYHHLHQLYKNGTPTLLISAVFHKGQPFFTWYGGLFRKMLGFYKAIFVQDENSVKLLASLGVKENVFLSGDTRFDRVAEIAAHVKRDGLVENFLAGAKALIAGSTWPDDEKIIKKCLSDIPDDWKLIIAPHEIDAAHLKNMHSLFGEEMIFYSQLANVSPANEKRILVVDNIGMLASLYAYSTVAYVGGGFQKGGIHNILEPAVYGLPVIFGPIYKKFAEAVEMKKKGLAFSVRNADEMKMILTKLIRDEIYRLQVSGAVLEFMRGKKSATERILQMIEERNWLNHG
jgi:3-deoxy-D-manno-octulosonic-acid transferase